MHPGARRPDRSPGGPAQSSGGGPAGCQVAGYRRPGVGPKNPPGPSGYPGSGGLRVLLQGRSRHRNRHGTATDPRIHRKAVLARRGGGGGEEPSFLQRGHITRGIALDGRRGRQYTIPAPAVTAGPRILVVFGWAMSDVRTDSALARATVYSDAEDTGRLAARL